MTVLILGISNIVTRRVLPALAGIGSVKAIHLASRRPVDAGLVPAGKRGEVFQGYERALGELEPGLAYVSLPNSLHAPWVKRALEAGFHVVVDKPAATSAAEAEELIGLAAERDLCLAEATVWTHHPQFQAATEVLTALGETVKRVSVLFSFPPLPQDNFRNDPRLGGGCILDLGPYAASCGRHFFGGMPAEVTARVLSRDTRTGVETAFSLLATYPEGGALTGHFGFDTEYRNSISVLGPGMGMDFDRAFTAPPDIAAVIRWRHRNQAESRTCPPGDSFALFLHAVIGAIQTHAWKPFMAALRQDATFIEQIKTAAIKTVSQERGHSCPHGRPPADGGQECPRSEIAPNKNLNGDST